MSALPTTGTAGTLGSPPDLFDYPELSPEGELHIKFDQATGLKAIVAIHSTRLGPALGGCRLNKYRSFAAAVEDALRLARSMSCKAAIAGLPYGGGKAVLLRPAAIADRVAYFESFGRFIDSLNGRYITAEDVGTGVMDMDAIALAT
ncbi:MAG: amino acid dehydrogenase, partial [Pseudomonadota bacterium]|nr:amino acid dehydrogenase [Pseudomonadota bacterium]